MFLKELMISNKELTAIIPVRSIPKELKQNIKIFFIKSIEIKIKESKK